MLQNYQKFMLVGVLSLAVGIFAGDDDAKKTAREKILRDKKPAAFTPDDLKVFDLPGCFRDKNNNGVCDKSTKENGQCKRDCIVPDYKADKKAKKDKTERTSFNPCAGCTLGNCANCGRS